MGGASNCSSRYCRCLPVAMAMKDGEGGNQCCRYGQREERLRGAHTFGSGGREKRIEEVQKKREKNIKEKRFMAYGSGGIEASR
jgi:hypothetical protein